MSGAGPAADRAHPGPARWLAVAALALLLAVAAVAGKVLWDGRGALAAGDAALAHGDVDAALRHWRAAAHAYLPGAPYAAAAQARLLAAADDALVRGEPETAVRAYRAVRQAALDTAWAVTPFAQELARAEAALVRLGEVRSAALPPAAQVATSADTARRWAAVALLGLGLAALGVRTLRRHGGARLALGQALAAVLLFAMGALLFAAGVHQV